ncbi:MAG: thioesterase, partial [Pseudomonadota bacterium]|nr:thioesterase [Pseudomonadota bacterium]
HRMYHADKKFLSATTEIMTVHVDLDERKVVPMADHIQSNVADLYNAHRGLPCPEKAGRRVAIATR